MKSYSAYFILTLICLFTGLFPITAQFNIPKKPGTANGEQTSMYDLGKLLTDSQEKYLETKLIKYSDSTSTQIVIITIESLNGENIGLLAPRWGQQWGIGQGDEDNGVVILLAKKERKIWISPGYGVEDRLTAGITGEIVRNVIIPEFKRGDYYMGLDKGTDALFDVLRGAYKGTRKKSDNADDLINLVFLIIGIFIILLIKLLKGNKNGRGNGGNRSGMDMSDIIILSSLGRGDFGSGSSGGGFGSGSSGGGFGSGGFGGGFGGGGFSGGGAGGSW